MEFKYKKAFVTGGSAGLGLGLVRELLKQGAEVTVLARHEKGLENLRKNFPQVKTIRGDIADKKSVHRIYAESFSRMGDADLLIHNASSLGPPSLRPLLDTECEDLTRALETNLLGPFRLTKLMLPAMLLKRRGLVIHISSDAALQSYPNWGAYSVSKSAFDHLARLFQAELPPSSGVQFMAIDPGDMNTALHHRAVPDADPSSLHDPDDSAKLLIARIQHGPWTAEHGGLR